MSDDVNRPTSFALHIQPLFRQVDADSMHFMFDLTKYDDVVANSRDILSCLKGEGRSRMPPVTQAGPWPNEWIALFNRWIDEGHPA